MHHVLALAEIWKRSVGCVLEEPICLHKNNLKGKIVMSNPVLKVQ